jgi:Na+-driven multidrug efflux pump
VLYDKARVNALVTVVITIVIIALLVFPVFIIWHFSKDPESSRSTGVTIGVLLIFPLIFSIILSFFTKAKRYEILGAAAA